MPDWAAAFRRGTVSLKQVSREWSDASRISDAGLSCLAPACRQDSCGYSLPEIGVIELMISPIVWSCALSTSAIAAAMMMK